MTAPILITGGTGKVGSRVAAELRARGVPIRVASRDPKGPDQVRFDWADSATFTVFHRVEAVFVVAPPGADDPLSVMRPGLEAALDAHVRRFVLCGASSIERDGPMTGPVYGWLADHAPDWAVLRPAWFMQNFSEGQHFSTIRDEDAIYSATGDGRVPFIEAGDIARVAAVALMKPPSVQGEVVLTGPEALSYDAVAAILSDALGRRIVHHRLSPRAMAERFEGFGLPADFAAGLAAMDAEIATGSEDRVTDSVLRITGNPPVDFSEFVDCECTVWDPNRTTAASTHT